MIRLRPKSFIRDLFAWSFWIYFPIKVFIYDLDLALMNHFAPQYAWMLNLKFPIIAFIFLMYWLIWGAKQSLLTILYIIFFPIIIIFGKAGKFLIANYILIAKFLKADLFTILLYLGNIFMEFKRHFKYRLILFYFFVLCTVIIFLVQNKYLLFICIGYQLVYLGTHYIYKIHFVLTPTTLLSEINRLFNRSRARIINAAADSEKVNRGVQKEQIHEILFKYYILLFLRHKIRKLHNSPAIIAYYVLSCMYTIILTILVFSFCHRALYAALPSAYLVNGEVRFSALILLSINALIGSEFGLIAPENIFSSILITLEGLIGWFIALLYVALLFMLVIKHYDFAIKAITSILEEQSGRAKTELQIHYGMTLSEALAKIAEDPGKMQGIEFLKSNSGEGKTGSEDSA